VGGHNYAIQSKSSVDALTAGNYNVGLVTCNWNVCCIQDGSTIWHVCCVQDGSTMLMEAAKGGHFETMSLLLDLPTSSSSSQTATSTDAANKVVAAYCIILVAWLHNGLGIGLAVKWSWVQFPVGPLSSYLG